MDERQEDRERRYAELVGEKLRRLRQDRGLSLQEVCERSGDSFVVSTLSAYERGKRSLSLERLYELATIYGQSPMSILDIEDEPEFQRTLTSNGPLRIRLDLLDRLEPEERRPLETYLAFLREAAQRSRPGNCSPSARTTSPIISGSLRRPAAGAQGLPGKRGRPPHPVSDAAVTASRHRHRRFFEERPHSGSASSTPALFATMSTSALPMITPSA